MLQTMPLRHRRTALAALAVSAALGIPAGASAQGTQIVSESFSGPLPSSGWTFGGTTTPSIASSGSQSPGSALRLTAAGATNAFGWAQYTLAQPASAGLDITFWQSQWGGVSPSGGADGLSFFLKDGSDGVDSVGATGAALGYAPGAGNVNGLSGALLGIGLDAWGGFGDPNGTIPGCPGVTSSFHSTQLLVRGPQTGTRLQGYCLLPLSGSPGNYRTVVDGPALLQTPSPNNQPWTGNSVAWGSRANGAQQWRIVVDPSTTPNPKVTVTRVSAGTAITHVVDQPSQLTSASTFKFGFASATGSWTNNNEVWGLQISSVVALAPIDITRLTLPSGTVGATYACQAVTTASGVNPVTFAVVAGSLPPGLTLNPATGEICGTPTRGGNYAVTVRATDSRGGTPSSDDQPYTLAIDDIAPPCTPIDLRATARSRGADLSWREDPDPSCPGITQFEVEAETGETCTVPYPTATCAISGLAPGAPVRFRVRARNAAGTSAWSAYSEAVTPPALPAAEQATTGGTLVVASLSPRRGTTLVSTVVVPGPGAIAQVGRVRLGGRTLVVCRDGIRSQFAGSYSLSCQFTPAARARLCARSLRVTVRTTFTPSGGQATSTTQAVAVPRRSCRPPAVTG